MRNALGIKGPAASEIRRNASKDVHIKFQSHLPFAFCTQQQERGTKEEKGERSSLKCEGGNMRKQQL
jgi:hypothetical protein